VTLPTGIRGRLVALAILLIPLILLARYLVLPTAGMYLEARENLKDTRSEIARYQRLLGQAPALREAIVRFERTTPLAPFLLAGGNRSLAAAGLQRHLQDAAKEHGVTVLSLRVQNPVGDGPLERIAVDARLRAGTAELRDLLYFFETSRPYLFVEDLSINVRQSRRRTAQAGRLEVRLTLYGLRATESASGRGARNG
jgi:general secretion pathway protein M